MKNNVRPFRSIMSVKSFFIAVDRIVSLMIIAMFLLPVLIADEVSQTADDENVMKRYVDKDRELMINRLIIDPSNSSILYLGTSDGLYKSTDGGKYWERTGFNGEKYGDGMEKSISVLAFDPHDSNTIYVFAGFLYKSKDGGKTWEKTNLNYESSIYTIVIDPRDNNNIYVGVSEAIFNSKDGGKTWNKLNNGLDDIIINSLAIDPRNSDVLYAGSYYEGIIYKSVDGGKKWETLDNTFCDGIIEIVVDPTNTSKIFVLAKQTGWGCGLFVTKNGGINWDKVKEEDREEVVLHNKHNGGIDRHTNSIIINPTNSNIIYVETISGLYKSMDSGVSWKAPEEIYPYGVSTVVAPSNFEIIYAYKWNGLIVKSSDGGTTWEILTETYRNLS